MCRCDQAIPESAADTSAAIDTEKASENGEAVDRGPGHSGTVCMFISQDETHSRRKGGLRAEHPRKAAL